MDKIANVTFYVNSGAVTKIVKIWRILHALVKSHQTADSLYQLIRQIMDRLRYYRGVPKLRYILNFGIVGYPIILVVVWLPGTINRIYETAGGTPLFWLALVHRTFANSQGLFNAIIYGLNTTVKKSLRRACKCNVKNPLSPSRYTRLEWFKQITYSLSPPRYSYGKQFDPSLHQSRFNRNIMDSKCITVSFYTIICTMRCNIV